MYIDANVNKPDADVDKIYEYLVMVSYMLSVKRRFFNREDYYDKFAHYFATSVYMRMTDKRQFLDKNDENYIRPIKSCLNYMKNIIYARKCAFCFEEFNFTTKLSDAEEFNMFKDFVYSPASSNTAEMLATDIDLYFRDIDGIIKKHIYRGVYGKDKLLAWKLYVAVLVSLLNSLTLPNSKKDKLVDFKKTYKYSENKADCRIFVKNNYEDMVHIFMLEESIDSAIAFNLPDEYADYIYVILQKVKQDIVKDIKNISSDYALSDEFIEDLIMSNLCEGNANE